MKFTQLLTIIPGCLRGSSQTTGHQAVLKGGLLKMVVTGPTPEIPWISIGGEMMGTPMEIHGKYLGNPRSIDLL